jgi:hypothetical protein
MWQKIKLEQVDPEALGREISHTCKWDGQAITEAFIAALTDANFHTFAEKVTALWEAEK